MNLFHFFIIPYNQPGNGYPLKRSDFRHFLQFHRGTDLLHAVVQQNEDGPAHIVHGVSLNADIRDISALGALDLNSLPPYVLEGTAGDRHISDIPDGFEADPDSRTDGGKMTVRYVDIFHGVLPAARLKAEIVIRTGYPAPCHKDISASVEIEAVSIVSPIVADLQIFHPDVFTIQKCGCPCGGLIELYPLQLHIAASQETNHHGPVNASFIRKAFRISVDDPLPHDSKILRLLRVDETAVHVMLVDIAVVMSVRLVRGNGTACCQLCRRCHDQIDARLHIQRSGDEFALFQQNVPAALLAAPIDCRLNRFRVQTLSVPRRAKIFY